MRKTYNLAILSLLVLTTILVFAACSGADKDDSAKVSRKDKPGANNLSYDSLTVELQGMDSLTVLEVLTQTHQVDCINTAAGVFVRGIDSVYGSDDYFWLYSVNDSMPQVAADRCLTRSGDVVKWHFRRIDK